MIRRRFPEIPGLVITHELAILGKPRLDELVRFVESRPPASTPKRHRIDLYGAGAFNAGYGTGRLVSTRFPPELVQLAEDLVGVSQLSEMPDAITISEYLPGEGVGLHTDRVEAGPVIVGLSVIGACTVRFQRADDPPIDLPYPAGAIMTIAGDCRNTPWRHAILPVAERRISIVMRRAA